MDVASGSPPEGGGPLPCLNRNKCTNPDSEGTKEQWQKGRSAHKKSAATLARNVERLCRVHGVEKVGFLTLTFAEHILDPKEAQKRFHSLKTHVLNVRYKDWIRVFERQKSGRIHYHLLVVTEDDIRTGANFEEFAKGKGHYQTANSALRREWHFWNPKGLDTATKYRFGRTELMPIKSTGEAIGKYVGKYIEKHIGQREERDQGVRLVAYSKGAGASNCKFSWHSPGATNHRRKKAFVAKALGYTESNWHLKFPDDFGDKWGYLIGPSMSAIRFTTYPTLAHARSDYPEEDWGLCPEGSTNIELGGSYVARAAQSQADAVTVAFNERSRFLGADRGQNTDLRRFDDDEEEEEGAATTTPSFGCPGPETSFVAQIADDCGFNEWAKVRQASG